MGCDNMRKRSVIIFLLFICLFFVISPISSVKADDIINNDTEEGVSQFDYSDEDFEEETTENESSNDGNSDEEVEVDEVENGEVIGKQFKKKNSFGVVLVEIFCGMIGIFMLILSFRIKDN